MKSIQVVKGDKEDSLFAIKDYSFVEVETENPPIPIYRMSIKKNFKTILDARYWLFEINGNIKELVDAPKKLIDYIVDYEENINFRETYLFHDLRTKYCDILLYNAVEGVENNVILVGVTCLEEETCFSFKAFSLKGLFEFVKIVTRYCQKQGVTVRSSKNVKWMQIEQYMVPSVKFVRDKLLDSLLDRTISEKYFDVFFRAFKCIDGQGYLDKAFLESKIKIGEHTTKINAVNQFTRYFSPFWKQEINIKDSSRIVLCLHDELQDNESIDKVVYTLKPYLMKYYQLHWFEDFCEKIIKNINIQGITINNIYSGRIFNFFQDGITSNNREIDILLEVKKAGVYKVIAIECKKTLTEKEIRDTNKKIKNKILKSHMDIIDAYIHIGCFYNTDVNFNKKLKESNTKRYKQEYLQLPKDSKATDYPYFAFAIDNIKDFKEKLEYILNEIFEQW